MRRFEASSRPPGGGGRAGRSTAAAVFGGSLESSKRHHGSDPRHRRGIQISEWQQEAKLPVGLHTPAVASTVADEGFIPIFGLAGYLGYAYFSSFKRFS